MPSSVVDCAAAGEASSVNTQTMRAHLDIGTLRRCQQTNGRRQSAKAPRDAPTARVSAYSLILLMTDLVSQLREQ